MRARETLRETFLKANGLGACEVSLLAGDASFRKYFRLRDEDKNIVLMDAPPPAEDVRPFVRMARYLEEKGFSAPKVYASDEENGFLLLEDLGDATYTRLLNNGEDEWQLYELATDLLVDLQKKSSALPEGLAPYDRATYQREADLLAQWWMPSALGSDSVSETVLQEYRACWARCITPVLEDQASLVLRDYHVDNLLIVEGRNGLSACGLLDFQDALAGSRIYDLMSLLEDARRDIDPNLVEAMKQRFLDQTPDYERADFDEIFALIAAQRHAKVIGIFTRLKVRDGKGLYLEHLPRVWRLFEQALEHSSLAPLKSWVDAHIPKEKRGVPLCLKD